jgi:hypothetical protein
VSNWEDWIMRPDPDWGSRTLGVVSVVGVVLLLAPFAAHAQKPAKSYPQEGKVVGRGTTEHSMGPTNFYTQVYKVQTDKILYVLDCGKKPFFGKTGAECGGEKKIEIGDTIHFRIEKNAVYIPVKEPGIGGMQEQKLRIMSQELRPDFTTEKPEASQPQKP